MKGGILKEPGVLNYMLANNSGLKGFLQAFYLRVSEANQFEREASGGAGRAASGEPIFAMPREDRRLDAFARLLELDNHDCAAICIAGNRIMVAVNSELGLDRITAGSLAGPPIMKVKSKIVTLQLHFCYMQENMKKLEALIGAKSYYHPLITQTRKIAMGAIIPFVQGDETAHLLRAMWDVLDEFALYENEQTIFAPERIDKWFELYKKLSPGLKIEKLLSDKHLYIIQRTLRDLLKLEKYLIDLEDEHPLKKYFFNIDGDIKLIFVDGEKGVHAEMKLLLHALTLNLKIDYIGISKLCCPYCITATKHAGVELEYGESEEIESGTFSVRGHHGKGGPWVLSRAMLKNDKFMRSLLGDFLYDQYKGFAGTTVKDKSGKCFALQEVIGDSIPFIHQKQFVELLQIEDSKKIKTLSSLYVPASVSGEGVDESVRGIFYPDYGIVVLEGGSYFGKKIDKRELQKLLTYNSKGKVVRIHTNPSARLEDFDDELSISTDVAVTRIPRSYIEDLTDGKMTTTGAYSDEVVMNILKGYLYDDIRFHIVPLREDVKPNDFKFRTANILKQLIKGKKVVSPVRLKNGNLAAGIWTLGLDEASRKLLVFKFFDLNGCDIKDLGFLNQRWSLDIPGYYIVIKSMPFIYSKPDELSARIIDLLIKFAKYVDDFNSFTLEQLMAKVAPSGYVNKLDYELRAEHAKIIFDMDCGASHRFEIDKEVYIEGVKKFGRNNIYKIFKFLHKKHHIVDVSDLNHYLKILLSGEGEYSEFLSKLPPAAFRDSMFIPGVSHSTEAHYSGLNRVKIDGDGHCFYAAVIEGLKALGREYTIAQLREEIYKEFIAGETSDENRMLLEIQIVDMIATGNFDGINKEFRITLLKLRQEYNRMQAEHIPKQDIDTYIINQIRELNLVKYYIAMMKEYPVWAGDVEIGILGRFLGVTFQIYRFDGRIDVIDETQNPANPLLALEYTGNHYNLLINQAQYDARMLGGGVVAVDVCIKKIDPKDDKEEGATASSTTVSIASGVVSGGAGGFGSILTKEAFKEKFTEVVGVAAAAAADIDKYYERYDKDLGWESFVSKYLKRGTVAAADTRLATASAVAMGGAGDGVSVTIVTPMHSVVGGVVTLGRS